MLLDGIHLSLFCALLWSVRMFVTDDAFITLRHAERLAAGDGFVWNAGGPRCEGFSNPLFFLFEAGAIRAGGDGMAAARAVGVMCSLTLVVALRRMGTPVVGASAAAAAALWMAASAPFAFWTVSGLETAMVVLIVTAGALVLARPDGGRPGVAGALFAVLPWLRPEGPVPALALALLSEAPAIRNPRTRRHAIGRLAWIAGPVIASSAVLEALRWNIYGHLMPNSAVLKMGNAELGEVTLPFLTQIAPAGALVVGGAMLLRGRARLIAVPGVVWLAGSVHAWNNVNDFGRFLLPTVPAWMLVAGVGLDGIAAAFGSRRPLAMGAGALALALSFASWPVASTRRVTDFANMYAECRSFVRQSAGRWLADNVPAGQVYAIVDAGVVPFVAGGTALDTIALNDPRIQETGALSWTDRAATVLADRPDFIVIMSGSGTELVPRYRMDQAVVDHPDFAASYVLATQTDGGEDCPYHLPIYRRVARTTE